jgi:hypothetical protein
MDITKLLDKNLAKVFIMLKSISVQAKFHTKLMSDFDFSNSDVISSTTIVEASIIPLGIKKDNKDKSVVTQLILVQSKDINDLNFYDKIFFSDDQWSLKRILKRDRSILLAELKREG